ncbi:MAG: C1 family peptidase [Bacteroidales bacterium]|jgi:bleomycin hydrolase|nr:C1 family peptidase [Bacteroidales bacterium]
MKSIYQAIILSTLMLISNNIFAQGELNAEDLGEIRSSLVFDDDTRALMNAISSNDIRKLAVNRENLGRVNEYFSDKVDIRGITDQKSSGRCWLFTGLNVLRPKVIQKYNMKEFEFSQTYGFFWDQLEKSNLFLEGIIETASLDIKDRKVEWLLKHPIGDGGQWTGVVDILGKYGAVPASVMPESQNSSNTSVMSRFLRRKLREDALVLRQLHADGKTDILLREEKLKMLGEIYRMLVLCLGEPPAEFDWQYEDMDGNVSEMKKYTPMSFYDEIVGVDLGEYVMFMNDPTRPYYKLYEIEYDRHMLEGGNWKYINLPIDDIKTFAKASIQGNEAMYFSCDVGKQLEREKGMLDLNNFAYDALFGVDFSMDKEGRIKTFDSGSSHGMSLVGVNVLPDGSIDKWLLENSWGKTGHQGFLIMTDEWFREYMFRLVINKKYIDAGTLEILDTEPVFLPPWDPMFAPEE